MVGNPRLVALATGVLGVITIVIALAFSMLPEVTKAGDCFADSAVLQFEFARDKADLERIFDVSGGRCREPARIAMDQANQLDVYGFIPAYTAFNVLAVLFLAGGWRPPLAAAAIGAAVLAAAADYVETVNLLAISQVLDTTGVSRLAVSTPAAITKFVLLGLYGLFTAAICMLGPPRRPILGIVLLLPPLATILLIMDPVANYQTWAAAVFVAYAGLSAVAFWKAARR